MSAVNINSEKIKELFEKLKSGKITSVTTSTSGTQPTSYEQQAFRQECKEKAKAKKRRINYGTKNIRV